MSEIKKKPTRPTRAKLTRQQVFLQAYRVCGCITQAAQAAKVDPSAHYNWLQRDPEYREAFDAAEKVGIDLLISEARRRALEGDSEPCIYQGSLCYERLSNGKKRQIVIKRKSDVLLMFLIKAARPETFRDNWKGEIRHTGSISSGPDLSNLTDDQLQQLNRMLELANGSSSPIEGIVVGSAGGTGEEET